MTREEAIKIIDCYEIIDCYDINFYDLSGEKIPAYKLGEAFDMAIDALSDTNTAEWEYDPNGHDWNLPAWKCSKCHFVTNEIPPYIKSRDGEEPVNPYMFAGSKFCGNCGRRMMPKEKE